MPFVGDANPLVKQVGDRDWEVVEPLTYRGTTDEFVVPAGMPTDFASVPRAFVWFLPRYGRYTRAAILHDYLWRFRVNDPNGAHQPRRRRWPVPTGHARARRSVPPPMDHVDGRALGSVDQARREEGVDPRRSRRCCSSRSWPCPFVLPPALLVLVGLGAFYLLELLLVLPLKAGRALRSAMTKQEPRKDVSVPTFDWNTS